MATIRRKLGHFSLLDPYSAIWRSIFQVSWNVRFTRAEGSWRVKPLESYPN